MTSGLRGLIVENEPINSDLIAQAMQFALAQQDCTVEWSIRESPLEAQSLIEGSLVPDFAIVDYDLGQHQPKGPTVIAAIRRRAPNAYILAVSGYPNEHPDFRDDSLEAGASDAIIRGQLTGNSKEWSYASLASKIVAHLTRHGRISRVTLVLDADRASEDALGLESILHSLGGAAGLADESPRERGERIFRNLTIGCLNTEIVAEGAVLTAHFLAPGRSGAHVCRVDLDQPNEPLQSFIVKIGLDRSALEHERSTNKRAARALTHQSLMEIIGDVRSDPTGYSAIAARLATQDPSAFEALQAVTLGSWLLRDDTISTPVQHVADILFGEQLGRLFQRRLRGQHDLDGWLQVSPLFTLRTLDAMRRYEPVWGHAKGAGQRDFAELRDVANMYVTEYRLPTSGPLPAKVTYTHGFGDLHSSNVLVQTGVHSRPVLVDASAYGPQHWAGDAARLLVDLVLRVRAPGAPALLWDDFKDLGRYADSLCPVARLAKRPSIEDVGPVDVFIGRVLERLTDFLHIRDLGLTPSEWHWQWHVAVAKEFLRQGTREDLAPPRGVLALTSAAHHLQFAGRLLDQADIVSLQSPPPACIPDEPPPPE